MKIRYLVLTLAAAAIVSVVPGSEASAHDRHHRSRVSVGVGFGYPGFYRPFGYYGGYYGGYYYPRSYLGFGISPRPRVRRDRAKAEVNNRALYVYPANGQSEQQLADDRYDCHVWSVDSTGFDPTRGAGSREDADDYARAFTACMEGRHYVVR